MTALNLLIDHNAVHILTDGAVGSGERVVRKASKVWIAPDMNFVMSARGEYQTLKRLFDHLSWQYPTFDSLVDGLMNGEFVWHSRRARLFRQIPLQLALAGISESTGAPRAFLFFNGRKWVRPNPVNTPIEISRYFIGHEDEAANYRFVDQVERARSEGDRERAFVDLIDAQRAHSTRGCVVGCFAQLTTVKRRNHNGHHYPVEISTRIIRRWPERLFAPIDPSLGPIPA